MNTDRTRPRIPTLGLLLSGGLDSAILLGHMLRNDSRIRPFYVRSQVVWEKDELKAVRSLLAAMASPRLAPLVILDMPLGDLYELHWSISGEGTPAADTDDEAVYLPGRNALLTLKPAMWCIMHGVEELALGVLGTNPFPDATEQFFSSFAKSLELATGRRLQFLRPFATMDKRSVMELGREMPLEHTFSCIAPVRGKHCGRCNKCAERQHAFDAAGMNDPTHYALQPFLI